MSEQVLKGKIAIVTGGGRGLGRAMTLAMVDAGAKVTAASRGEDSLAALAKEAASTSSDGELLTITADIRSREDCRKRGSFSPNVCPSSTRRAWVQPSSSSHRMPPTT